MAVKNVHDSFDWEAFAEEPKKKNIQMCNSHRRRIIGFGTNPNPN